MIFRTEVCEKQELVSIQSAMWLTPIENNHMARYGRADRKPFYTKKKEIRLITAHIKNKITFKWHLNF